MEGDVFTFHEMNGAKFLHLKNGELGKMILFRAFRPIFRGANSWFEGFYPVKNTLKLQKRFISPTENDRKL